MRLKRFFFLVIAICAVVPVIHISGLLLWTSHEREKNMIINNLELASKIYSNTLEYTFSSAKSGLEQCYLDPDIQMVMKNYNDARPSSSRLVDVAIKTMQVRIKTTDWIKSVSIVDSHGTVLLNTDRSRIGKPTRLPGIALNGVRNRGGYFVSDIFMSKSISDFPVYAVAAPLGWRPIGEAAPPPGEGFSGVMAFFISTEYLQKLVEAAEFFKSYKTGVITIVDATDKVAATTNSSLKIGSVMALKPILEKEKGERSGFIEFTFDGLQKVGYYSLISDSGWKIICSVGKNELLAPLHRMMTLNILFIIGVLGAVSLLYLVIIRQFTTPIYGLLSAIRRARAGERGAKFEYDKQDEFGEIAETYNLLIDEVNAFLRHERERSEFFMNKANHDPLTDLLNKTACEEAVQATMDTSPDGGCGALFIMDIDNFKRINDSFGHSVGDLVIRAVAGELRGVCRAADIAGRIGGDEFVIFYCGLSTDAEVSRKAEEIRMAFVKAGEKLEEVDEVTGSVGCARWPKDASDFGTLYRAADSALYNSKENGRNRWTIYGGDR